MLGVIPVGIRPLLETTHEVPKLLLLYMGTVAAYTNPDHLGSVMTLSAKAPTPALLQVIPPSVLLMTVCEEAKQITFVNTGSMAVVTEVQTLILDQRPTRP